MAEPIEKSHLLIVHDHELEVIDLESNVFCVRDSGDLLDWSTTPNTAGRASAK